MKRVLLLTLAFTFVALAATAVVMASQNENEFEGMVHVIETRYHAHATRIPLMGVVSVVAHVGSKGGVSNVNVVTFENFKNHVDGAELTALVEGQLGTNWRRMIRETHKDSNEQTLIYARPEGNRMGLVVIDVDNEELNLVSVSVDPRHLQEQVAKYSHSSHDAVNSSADESGDSAESN
jgi:hypothetical protein